MSKFKYYKKSKDSHGHVVYYCYCASCGSSVAYSKRISVDPLCETCKNKKRNEFLKNQHEMKARMSAMDDCIRIVEDMRITIRNELPIVLHDMGFNYCIDCVVCALKAFKKHEEKKYES